MRKRLDTLPLDRSAQVAGKEALYERRNTDPDRNDVVQRRTGTLIPYRAH